MADGTEAGIIIPAYWSGDGSKFARAAAIMPSGTILCGAPGFVNDLPWYGSDSGPSGTGSGQAQTRDSGAAAAIATCHTAGLKVLPYIAMHGAEAGTGFDGHYSDLNAVLGKIDKAFALYPEYDGVFCDEAPLGADGAAFMASVVARIHSHGGIAVANLASAQTYSGAVAYGDYVVLAETAWDSRYGEGGPYGAVTDPGDRNFIYQPDFVTNDWPKSKIVYWIFGVPNVAGMAQTARATLYAHHNVGNIYLSNFSPYYERWAQPADDPLFTEQAHLAGAVLPPPTATLHVGGVAATPGADGTTATLDATATRASTWVFAYGATSGYGSSATATAAIRAIVTLSGLTPGATYHYRITATDADGNVATTPDNTFLALATPAPGPTPAPGGTATTIRAIQESPYTSGALAALAGNGLFRSFDRGVHWARTLAYPDAALVATRLAQGRFADASLDKSYAWVSFAGTSSNTLSRLLDEARDTDVDIPAAARPAQFSGLTIGLRAPSLALVDTIGTGRSWRIADFTANGNLEATAWDASFGLPRHIIRDGAIDDLIYGAADSAIFKTYDGFATVHSLLALVSPRVGRMVGYGRLAHAPAITGDLLVSAFLNPGPTNPARQGRATPKIIKLAGSTWSAVADHPIPTSAHTALQGGRAPSPSNVTLAAWSGFTETFCNYVRPLVRGKDGALYTYAFIAYAEEMIGVTPGYANLFKSTDLGATWTVVAGIAGVTALDVAADGALWAVAGDGQHLAKSADGGTTWTTVLADPHAAFPAASPWAGGSVLGFLNRWTGVSCGATGAGDIAVSDAYFGFARSANGATFTFTTVQAAGFVAGNYGVCRVPAGGATLVEKRRTPGHTTFRFPDSVTSEGAGDYSTLGDVLSPANGAGQGGPNAYRRLGARVYFVGRTVVDGFAGDGTTYVSTDGGATWSQVLTTADMATFDLQNGPSYDVAYDATTDTTYLGLADPHHGATHVTFLARSGGGAWRDLTAGMAGALGGLYTAHTLGMVAGVR